MKKILFSALCCFVCVLANQTVKAQTVRVGVFDLDVMVQAMPGYHVVDSLVQLYEADSLGTQYEYNNAEYQRLDSLYKIDSGLVAAGKMKPAMLDIVKEDRRKVALNLVYWQQIAQNKSNAKRGEYAQPLYVVVANAYKKVLDKRKYTIILKPQTYEAGFAIDNIFLLVARELKLQGLPQELLYLGDDPDAPKQPAAGAKPPAAKPKN